MTNAVKFCEGFIFTKFCENKTLMKGEITLSFTDKVYRALVANL